MSIFLFSGGLGNQLFQLGAFDLIRQQQPKVQASTCVLDNPRRHETRRQFELHDYISHTRTHPKFFRYYIDFIRKVKIPLLTTGSLEAKYRYYYGGYQNLTSANRAKEIIEPHRSKYITSNFSSLPDKKTAAIHLRLGDFVTNRFAAEMSGVVGAEYLAKAMTFLETDSIEKIIVFSDEPSTASAIVSQISNVPVVKSEDLFGIGSSAFHDLFALSTFRTIVCTNSTYSFWGAHLSDQGSRVICPRYFYRDITREVEYIPNHWIKC